MTPFQAQTIQVPRSPAQVFWPHYRRPHENTYEHLMWRSPLVIEVEPDCEIDESAEVQFSIQDFQTLCDQLRNQFNDWLQSPEFQPIQTELFRLDVQAEITVTIESC